MAINLEDWIRDVEDFPKPGIVFKDIFPLLKEKFPELTEEFKKLVDWSDVDYVVGIESRGFILGCALANAVGKGFIPIRKKGKLPPPVLDESYSLEYGQDVMEIQDNDKPAKVVMVDDVLATGGTMGAAINLCKKANYEIKDIVVLINLAFLNNFEKEVFEVKSLLKYS